MIYLLLPLYIPDSQNVDMTKRCIESLYRKTKPGTYKLIVVNNGASHYFKEVESYFDNIVNLPMPLGYARAVNIGWAICDQFSDCEYVGVLNNDLTFYDGWLEALVKNIDDCTAATASYDFDAGDVVTDHVWSSCFLMKSETRKKIGFFDAEQLPYRYHDQDYWMRAKSMGLQFKRIGKSRVDHKESSTYKKMPEQSNEQNEMHIVQERWGTHMAQYWKAK